MSRRFFEKSLRKALSFLGIKGDGEVSLSFVSPQKMAVLNFKYLGKKGSTDVLSFPVSQKPFLGDIIICPSVAAGQAKKLNHSFSFHCLCLVVHGVLHLKDYDHHDLKSKKKMVAMEKNLIKYLTRIKNYSLLADERVVA